MAWRTCENCKHLGNDDMSYFCLASLHFWADWVEDYCSNRIRESVKYDRGPGSETECKAWESNNEH